VPSAASASASTPARSWADTARIAWAGSRGSPTGFVATSAKRDSASSMTHAWSPTTMQAALSSVKSGSNAKPRRSKGPFERG
jgi:hypothetical protein